MAPHSDKAEFRLLLVEDDPDLMPHLTQLMKERLHRPMIDSAMSVAEAMLTVEHSRQSEMSYHVALLDVRLPAEDGGNPETDFSVCDVLRHDRVPVVHISAYPDDPAIIKHMVETGGEDLLSPAHPHLVKKTASAGWASKLLDFLIAYEKEVLGKPIGQGIAKRIGRLLGAATVSASSRGSARYGHGDAEAHCGTPTMTRLKDDIISHWAILDKSTRDLVRNTFTVVEVDKETDTVRKLLLMPQV